MKLAPASTDAARYACKTWHYSGTLPAGKLVKYGVWEPAESFWGVVLFGRGATPQIGSPYGLRQYEIVELVRVALRTGHPFATTKAVAVAIRLLRKDNPGLRLIVSFADSAQGHRGSIYQAGNWIYAGSQSLHVYRVKGETVHPKTLHGRYGVGGQSIPWLRAHVDPNAERVHTPPKHRYLYPLDDAMRVAIEKLRVEDKP